MLARPKQKPVYETFKEREFYAARSLPKMYKETLAIVPLALVIPLFSIARDRAGEATEVDAVWSSGKRGHLRYRGPRLTQSHQTVLFTLANLRAGAVISNVFDFHPSALLAKMGWSDNADSIKRLSELLDDLNLGQVKLWGVDEVEATALRVSFVDAFKPAAKGLQWYVRLSEELLPLFAGRLTDLNMPARAKLVEGLPTFLYSYICANGYALPFSYQALYDACGACYADIRDFAKSVKLVLEQLKSKGLIQDYRLKGEDAHLPAGQRLAKGQFRVLKAVKA